MQFEVDLDGEQRHSSSVTDIVEGCKASIRSLLALEWPDEVESAQYNTRLSQVSLSLFKTTGSVLILSTISAGHRKRDPDLRQVSRGSLRERDQPAV